MSDPKMIRIILTCLTNAIDTVITQNQQAVSDSINNEQLDALVLTFEKEKIIALKSFFLRKERSRHLKLDDLNTLDLAALIKPLLVEEIHDIKDYQHVFNTILSMINHEKLVNDHAKAYRFAMLLKALELGLIVIALTTLAAILTLALMHVATPQAAFFAIPFILSCIALILFEQLQLPAAEMKYYQKLDEKLGYYATANIGATHTLSTKNEKDTVISTSSNEVNTFFRDRNNKNHIQLIINQFKVEANKNEPLKTLLSLN